MYQHQRLTTNSFGFFQKFKNFDYILLVCILLLGFISLATMYSTDGGKILFHTKSHFTKLVVFTVICAEAIPPISRVRLSSDFKNTLKV